MVPDKFNTNVFGWNKGWIGSGSNFLTGGSVNN
jgi:hypothetical protein